MLERCEGICPFRRQRSDDEPIAFLMDLAQRQFQIVGVLGPGVKHFKYEVPLLMNQIGEDRIGH